MSDGRKKDINWKVSHEDGTITAWDQIQVAVLMDIRDELKRLNNLLHCRNFITMPNTLTDILHKLPTRRRKKK